MNTAIEDIVAVAQYIFSNSNFLKIMNPDTPDAPQRTGGFMCIIPNDPSTTRESYAHIQLGTFPEERRNRYITLSEEKARRLQNSDPKILSSWETRNEAKDKKGGAIRAGNLILSFSGLPELGDEAFMLAVAHDCNLTSPNILESIAQKSGSKEIYKKLIALSSMDSSVRDTIRL